MSELGKMLAQLAKAQKQSQSEVNEDDLTDEQLVGVLRDTYLALSHEITFVPGDVIVHKYPPLANTVDAHRPAIFVEYINPFMGRDMPGNTAENLSSFKMALKQDCIILRMLGGKIVQFLEDSSEYQYHPDFIQKH